MYAGGDDLLLIAPWREALDLALALRQDFSRWTGGNPNVTLSAAIELITPDEPLNRAVAAAEKRLESAKRRSENGVKVKDAICVIQPQPVSWTEFERQLQNARSLQQDLDTGNINTALLYRLLYFDGQRALAEGAAGNGNVDLLAASWRGRWGYTLARNVRDRIKDDRQAADICRRMNALLGLDLDLNRIGRASPRIAVTAALYRNRTGIERSRP